MNKIFKLVREWREADRQETYARRRHAYWTIRAAHYKEIYGVPFVRRPNACLHELDQVHEDDDEILPLHNRFACSKCPAHLIYLPKGV